uniref:Uncharacterized protein n=1 Tax=Ditylenchus dipsaci TaxID=166011 RepID=A0A915CT71_9BILA
MLSIGLMDIMQLISHVLVALGMIFNWQFDGFLENIIGSLLFAAFMAAMIQHLILAVNRLLVVLQIEVSQCEFINDMVLHSLLAASWLWAILFFIINMSPMSGIVFCGDSYIFHYSNDTTLPWADTVSKVDF